MKKTLTVNLNNTVYHIDEDAYSQLQDYLESLNDYFRNEEGASEILSDIEARIAELFKERMRFGMQIITMREVDEIISVMGHPEDFASDTLNIEIDDKEVGEKEVENQNTEKGEDGTTPQEKIPERNRRRLFRDKDDAFLGGVASGIGILSRCQHSACPHFVRIVYFSYRICASDLFGFVDLYSGG